MVVGVLEVEIHFPVSQSLKAKRTLLKSVTDRLRRQFNVAVGELEGMDVWQRSVLAIAAVARDHRRVNQILSLAGDFLHRERQVQVTREKLEVF